MQHFLKILLQKTIKVSLYWAVLLQIFHILTEDICKDPYIE